MEKILTQVVETYVKCNEFSKDNLEEDLKSFTETIENVYRVNLVTAGDGSVINIHDYPPLDSLEHLSNDYLAGHLDNLAKRPFVNYKEALMTLRSTYSGEFKQSIWEVKLCTYRCSSVAFKLKKCTMYKRRVGGSTTIMIIIIIIIITTTLIMITITFIGILYLSKGALHHWNLRPGKNYEDTKYMHF